MQCATQEEKKTTSEMESGQCFVKYSYPAEYKTVEDRVLVSPATTKIETIPALIQTVEETVIDKPAKSMWVAGANDRYCFEEIPATYKTVKRDVVVNPETTAPVKYPEEYSIVKRKELAREARIEWAEVLCGKKNNPENISRIQRSLTKIGYKTGKDGELDPDTMTAITKYQKDKNLKINKTRFINLETIEALGIQL